MWDLQLAVPCELVSACIAAELQRQSRKALQTVSHIPPPILGCLRRPSSRSSPKPRKLTRRHGIRCRRCCLMPRTRRCHRLVLKRWESTDVWTWRLGRALRKGRWRRCTCRRRVYSDSNWVAVATISHVTMGTMRVCLPVTTMSRCW